MGIYVCIMGISGFFVLGVLAFLPQRGEEEGRGGGGGMNG